MNPNIQPFVWWIAFAVAMAGLMVGCYVRGWENGRGWPHNDYRPWPGGILSCVIILIALVVFK